MPGTLKTLIMRFLPKRVLGQAAIVVGVFAALAVFILPNITHFPDFEESAEEWEWQALQTGLNAMLADNAIETVIAHDELTSSRANNTWSALPAGPGTLPLNDYLPSVTTVYFYCFDNKARITQQFDTAEVCTNWRGTTGPAPELDRPFHVKVNQSALIESEALEIRLVAVRDSRCNPVVECYSPDDGATVLLRAIDTNSGEELDLELVLWEENQDLNTGNFGRYSVTLVELLPHPAFRTNGARDYTAVLLVSGGLITRLWPF